MGRPWRRSTLARRLTLPNAAARRDVTPSDGCMESGLSLFPVRGRLVVAALVPLSVLAFFCAASAPAAAARTMVIRLRSVTVAPSIKDLPPTGPSKGDVYGGRFRLLNVVPQLGRKAGAVVGTERSSLTLTSRTAAVIHGVVTLPGGTLVYGGRGRLGSSAPIPVIRGTGRFAGARGTLTVGNGNSPLNTYRLTLP